MRQEITNRCKEKYKDVEVVIPPLWCTTDNAAMIAKVGSYLYHKGVQADLTLSCDPSWKIENYLEFGAKK